MKTESKHTPGPWHIQSSGTCGTKGYYEFTITDSHGMEVVSTKQHVLGRTYPELIANSNLIAAAPELLEALRECITSEGATCFGDMENHPEWMQRRLYAITDIARAAIAKAEGSL